MKKILTLALLLGVGSFGLVGCGGAPAAKKEEKKEEKTTKVDGEKKTVDTKTEEKSETKTETPAK